MQTIVCRYLVSHSLIFSCQVRYQNGPIWRNKSMCDSISLKNETDIISVCVPSKAGLYLFSASFTASAYDATYLVYLKNNGNKHVSLTGTPLGSRFCYYSDRSTSWIKSNDGSRWTCRLKHLGKLLFQLLWKFSSYQCSFYCKDNRKTDREASKFWYNTLIEVSRGTFSAILLILTSFYFSGFKH